MEIISNVEITDFGVVSYKYYGFHYEEKMDDFLEFLKERVNDIDNELLVDYYDGKLRIDDNIVKLSDSYRRSLKNNDDSDFNTKIRELIKLSKEKKQALKIEQNGEFNSVDEALSYINFYEKRVLYNQRYINRINGAREYILNTLDKSDELYKEQLEKKIKYLEKVNSKAIKNRVLWLLPTLLFPIGVCFFAFSEFLASLISAMGLFYILAVVIGPYLDNSVPVRVSKIKYIISNNEEINKDKKRLHEIAKLYNKELEEYKQNAAVRIYNLVYETNTFSIEDRKMFTSRGLNIVNSFKNIEEELAKSESNNNIVQLMAKEIEPQIKELEKDIKKKKMEFRTTQTNKIEAQSKTEEISDILTASAQTGEIVKRLKM